MMRSLMRCAVLAVAVAVVSAGVVSCSGGSQTSSSGGQAQMMMYECPCGVKKSEAAGKPAPACCGKPMMVKK